MSTIEMKVHWVFNLTPDQTRLILSALGGRLRPEQVEEAKRLSDELTIMRAEQASRLADQLEQHAEKVGG